MIAGSGAFTKSGSGTLTLSGANTYTGQTAVSGGVLSLDATGSLSDSSDVLLGSGTKLSITGDEEVGSIEGGGDIELGTSRLTAGGLNSNTTFSGVIAGSGAFTKSGSGTLTLSGANTYTGQTEVSGGVLSLDASGSLSDSSAVSLSDGTQLSISGDEEVGSIEGEGDIELGTSRLTAGGLNTDKTFSGVIAGSGAFTKSGSGTLTLSWKVERS